MTRSDAVAPLRRAAAMSRRASLGLISGGAAALAFGRPPALAAETAPVLATPAQIEAEQILLRLIADPAVKAKQAQIRAELAATPRGQIPDAAARLPDAVAQWTNSLIIKEIAAARRPAIVWGTDDTPRTWLGHTIGGIGTSGDDPDNIYRSAFVDGESSYEITGQVDQARRPAQFSFEIVHGDGGLPTKLKDQGRGHADMGNQAAMLTDRDLAIGPDGRFRITLGGAADGANHVPLQPGVYTVGVRDTLSDWAQRPNRLAIRQLTGAPSPVVGPRELRRRVLAKLESYVRFWSAFPDVWFGGLEPNTIVGPIPRDGGWGFLGGLRYRLAPGEAIRVTTGHGDARYTGFQLVDPWMIGADARRHQNSLNLSQSAPGPDGRFTYVISPTDPGVANWLDTAGLHEGFGILRWQGFPPGATKDGLLYDFQVIRLADADSLAGLARVTPEARRLQLAERAQGYANRTR